MVDHGQTVVISLPNHSTPWLETVFTLQPWCYHGCTCSIHPLTGKIVAQTSQGLFNSKYERKHEMDSGSTSSKMTPSCIRDRGRLQGLSLFPVPWVPEVFLACGGNFRCWPKADTSSAVGRSREKNLWHGAVLFTVPVDLCAFLSDYIYANQIESLQL